MEILSTVRALFTILIVHIFILVRMFSVLNHEKFAREVLGRWFKHQKFTSFVRQLNMYGFHKIPHLQQGVLRSDTDTEAWHFEHPHFHRGQPDLLCLIQRKKQPPHGPGEDIHMDLNEPTHTPLPTANLTAGQVLDINSVVNGIAAIKRHQQTISSDLNELKTSNQHLWQEALAARERHKRHQDTINRILKFLAGVFGRSGENVNKHEDHTDPSPRAVIPRKRQRLMIGDGSNADKGKTTIVEEIDQEAPRKSFESAPGSTRYSTGMFTGCVHEYRDADQSCLESFARIDAPGSSIRSQSVGPPELFSPSPSEVSNGYYPTAQPLRPSEIISRGSTAEPPNHGSNPGSGNGSTPQPTGNVSASAPPPSLVSSLATSNGSTDPSSQMWGPALQQLLSSPTQFQRILHALQQNYPIAPPSDPIIPSASIQTTEPMTNMQPPNPAASQQITPYDPNAYDFSRFRTDLPEGQGFDAVANPAVSSLHLLGPEDDGVALEPLVQSAEQLHKTYQDAQEIAADVDALQYSINTLIENLGLDPNALVIPTSDHEDPVQPSTNSDLLPHRPAVPSVFDSTNEMNPTLTSIPPSTSIPVSVPTTDPIPMDPASTDFDFDAFLNELDNRNAGDHVPDYTSEVVSSSPPFGSVSQMDGIGDETTTESLPAFLDEVVPSSNVVPPSLVGSPSTPTTAGGGGRKRKSDVADLQIPVVQPEVSTTSPKVKRKR